ncbi:MAG: NADH-quinone oxidoreductase subunit NuoE [Hyphomicrobiales bacterium]|nr:NADH-quinone oxidoreductase subunit NuoE [Hyphomicrobiales bacterium]
MSARRLAQDSVQPAAFKFNRENAKWARATINKYPKGRQASAVIPLLMRAQDQDGWVTKASIETMADMLGMPYIRVLEVATFYTQFQLQPVGTKAHIQVCGTTPCMLRGAADLIAVCKKKISQHPFETSEDGSMSWEEVECQGACVNAPMIMVFKDTYEDLSPDRLEEIIDAFQAGKGDKIKTGPQIDRIFSSPFGGLTALTSDPNIKKRKVTARGKNTKTGAGKPVTKAKSTKTTPAKSASKTAKTSVNTTPAKAVAFAPSKDKNRPKSIKKPKLADDLKLISGVGPKLEGVLHSLGIYTFAQVAGWKRAELEWVDDYFNFKGRIERDDWIKQAKELAKGGR